VHFEDVIRTGDGLNNHKLVRAWVKEIVELTKEMDSWGIGLVRKGDKLDQKALSGQAYPRVVHYHDTTGKPIMKCLSQKSKDMGVQVLEHTIVGGLLKKDGGVTGAWGIQYQTGQLFFIKAKAVVLATGGMGRLLPITDNVGGITGEGYALAFRAGAELIDMEMVDFQVTACYPERMKGYPCHAAGFINLGGARLYNGLGERFMKKYFPDTGEKEKTRAQVAQSIGLEIYEGRGTSHGGIFLDASEVTPEMQKTFFPTIWNAFRNAGIDLSYQPIEVVPNAHTFLGGLRIDETASTSVPGLFAAGEAAGGVHGATRTDGGALSDALAFGAIAGRSAAHYARQLDKQLPWDEQQLLEVQRGIEGLLSIKGGVKPSELKRSIQVVANTYLNVVRDEEGLKKAHQELERIEREILPRMSAMEADQKKRALRLREAVEADGQLELAKIIATAALCRQESRGGHYRRDYPLQDDNNWVKNIVLKSEQGAISCRTVPTVREE
ncbi:FAD-binding protein, partial [Chloroflexota bacterium]